MLKIATLPLRRRPSASLTDVVRAGAAGNGESPGDPARHRKHRTSGLARLVVVTDICIVAGVIGGSQSLMFDEGLLDDIEAFPPWALSCLLVAAWIGALLVAGAWEREVVTAGLSGIRPVCQSALLLFSAVAGLSLSIGIPIQRNYLTVALPMVLLGLVSGRWVWHSILQDLRQFGTHLDRVVVAGSLESSLALATRIRNRPESGYQVSGICIPRSATGGDRQVGAKVEGFLLVGFFDDVLSAARMATADLVVAAPSDCLGVEEVRRMAWTLERTGVRLVVAPALVDIAGQRIRLAQTADLPLIRIGEPTFRGPKLIAKTSLDLAIAVMALMVLAPVFAVVSIAIKANDGGPVFFRQERVGLAGRTFHVLKFRSMQTDAPMVIQAVKQSTGRDGDIFFKAADDPRITPVGRFIRRTSIDELPQLINVLRGHMSIVGPRPLVPGEGSEVVSFVERRMLVKPGITGLWQVSGRSSLSAEARIRLDFYYVENWSLISDLLIMARTVSTVISRRGAC